MVTELLFGKIHKSPFVGLTMTGRLLQSLLLIAVFCPPALAETVTFKCDYKSFSDEEGNHAVKDEFAITFLVDSATGKAYMVGNQGSTEVKVVANADGLTFVEVTATGNVMVTVVSTNRESVHSRHGIILGEIVPSQYYGHCN